MSQSRRNKAVNNISWGYLSKAVSLVFPFIFRTVLIRHLGENYTGINSLFSSVLRVLNISELGISTALINAMYEPIAKEDKEKTEAYMNLFRKLYKGVGFVILCLGLIIVPFIPDLISGSYPEDINIYFIYFLFLLNTVSGYLSFAYDASFLEAMQRNDVVSRNDVIISICRYLCEIAMITLFKNYYAYLLVMILFTILNNLLHHLSVKEYYPDYRFHGRIEKHEEERLKGNIFAIFCHKIGGLFLNNVDNIVISAIFGLSMLVRYTNYYYIVSSVEAIVIICFSSITSIIGNIYVTETEEENAIVFRRVLFGNAWLVIVCASIMISGFQCFISLWVGDTYLFPIKTVVLFVFYFFIHSIRRTIIMYRDATGKWRQNKWQPLVAASFNLIVNLVLARKIGINGVILSSILSILLIDIPWESITFFSGSYSFTLKNYLSDLLVYMLSTLLIAGTCLLISVKAAFSGLLGFVIIALISFLLSNLLFCIFFCRRKEFTYFFSVLKDLLIQIKDRLFKRTV